MNPTDDSLLLTVIRHNRLATSLFVISLFLLASGLIFYVSMNGTQNSEEITFELASQTPAPAQEINEVSTEELIVVDVSGAVIKPGVYSLKAESRLQDAILAAGGMSDEADSMQVAKNLNLAQKVRDGMKIYIPVQGEVLAASSEQMGEKQLININTASIQELDTLPGIGQTIAQNIISNRPYKVITELQARKVVGAKVFSEIKDSIVAE